MAARYLLLWDRMGHYHVARWRALQARIGAEQCIAADLYASDALYGWKAEWAKDSEYRLLSTTAGNVDDTWQRVSAFIKLCEKEKIDAVAIAGYGRKEYVIMLVYLWLRGKRTICFAESWYGREEKADRRKGRFLNMLCAKFLVSGHRAATHFHSQLGIPLAKIEVPYSVVDNAHFAQGKQATKQENKTLLCVARFSEEKNLLRLIEAFNCSVLPQTGWHLLLVGGGPQQKELEKLAKEYAWLRLEKWLDYEALPQLYGSAHAFILASTFEPWGLVVNEALAAGLPVVLSAAVGCVPELGGDTHGAKFDPLQHASIVSALNLLPENLLRWTEYLIHSNPVDAISLDRWVDGLLAD
jgi:1,2-diacylglycerol 3-alpha-glucosyltransferase